MDPYILVKGNVTIVGRNVTQTKCTITPYASFTKCIKNIDGTTINDAENLDLDMPMYNLLF